MVAFPLPLVDDNSVAPSRVRATLSVASSNSSLGMGDNNNNNAPREPFAQRAASRMGLAVLLSNKVDRLLDHAADRILHVVYSIQAEFGTAKHEIPRFSFPPLWYIAVILGAVNALGYIAAMRWDVALDVMCTFLCFGAALLLATLPTITARGVLTRCQSSAALIFVWASLYTIGVDQGVVAKLTVADEVEWIKWVTLSFLWLLPHTLGLTSSSAGNLKLFIGGWMVALSGLSFGTVAHLQNWGCMQENGKICETGLWSVSQNPDLFGYLLFWIGIFLLNAAALVQQYPSSKLMYKIWGYRRLVIALLCGPWFMSTLPWQLAFESLAANNSNNIPILVPHPFLLFDTSVYKMPVILHKVEESRDEKKLNATEVVFLFPEAALPEEPGEDSLTPHSSGEDDDDDDDGEESNETDAHRLEPAKIVPVKRGTNVPIPPPEREDVHSLVEPATVPTIENGLVAPDPVVVTVHGTAPDVESPPETALPEEPAAMPMESTASSMDVRDEDDSDSAAMPEVPMFASSELESPALLPMGGAIPEEPVVALPPQQAKTVDDDLTTATDLAIIRPDPRSLFKLKITPDFLMANWE